MLNKRSSGILLHPTSLPGPFGSGDFGADAYRFVDWLVEAGQTSWQVLPLGEVGPGNSPYMSRSAFAGNVSLVDLAELSERGWLDQDDLRPPPGVPSGRVNYELVRQFRCLSLRRASSRFLENPLDVLRKSFDRFCEAEAAWLDDFALFMSIAEKKGWREWSRWPGALRHREEKALRRFEHDHADDISFWKFCQWNFFRQWAELRGYANERGVSIIGDVPIFVAHQSADVWGHQELFELDEEGHRTVVAGVPPDYFSETGQLWGNPLYRWDVHEQTGYAWWIARMRSVLKMCDMVRIDHFRGFKAYWEIPAGAPNAISGKWQLGPGEKFFEAMRQAFPQLPIIAEDLGMITQDVLDLRDQFNLPGMLVLQFAFGEGEGNHFLPHHYIENTVAYTGTHDNDTTLGWWHTAPEHVHDFARRYLHSDGSRIHWDMMRALSRSVANLVIFPMQDVLDLGGEYRMNFPGKPDGNWEWRMQWDQLHPEQTEALKKMVEESGR